MKMFSAKVLFCTEMRKFSPSKIHIEINRYGDIVDVIRGLLCPQLIIHSMYVYTPSPSWAVYRTWSSETCVVYALHCFVVLKSIHVQLTLRKIAVTI